MDRPISLEERLRDTRKASIDDDGFDYVVIDAVERDDKDVFVDLINSCTSKEDVPKSIHLYMFDNDSVNCAASVLAGETAGLFDIRDAGTNPLHDAASYSAPRLTALLLYSGSFIASARSDYTLMDLKVVLPLEVALIKLRSDVNGRNLNCCDSAIKLLTLLCRRALRDALETVRLLARNTKQLKREFLKYLNGGKMVEVGALLMVSRDLLLSSAAEVGDDFGFKSIMDIHNFLLTEKEKLMENAEMLVLLEIFGRISDKLAAYLHLDLQHIDNVVLEVASLVKDAGFHVKTEDIYDVGVYYRNYSRPFHENVLRVGIVNDNRERIPTAHGMPNWWGRKLVYLEERTTRALGTGVRPFATMRSMKNSKSASSPAAAVPGYHIRRQCYLLVAAATREAKIL